MLVLPIHKRGELILVEDDAGSGRSGVALARPRLARGSDGRPQLRLVRWVAPPDAAGGALPPVGGRLDLDVEISPTLAELSAAGLDPESVRPLPWLDASVWIEGPDLDSVEQEVSIAAGALGVVSVALTDHQAAVLAPLLTADVVSPLQLTWSGHVRVRLPALQVTATATVDEIRRRVESARGASLRVLTRSIIEASARIEILGPEDPELERALREWVFDELATRFAAGDDLVVRASAADVVKWPIRLATTLDGSLTAGERSHVVQEIVLDPAETGNVPPVEVRVLGDFEGPLERVDLRLQATAGGELVELAVTDDAPRSVPLGTHQFRWSQRLKLASRPSGEWSPWRTVEGSYGLVVSAPTPSELEIEVLASGLEFTTRWKSIHVVLEHHAPQTAPSSGVVELDGTHRSRTWTQRSESVRGTVSACLTYLSHRGLTVERTIQQVEGDQLVVRDPFDSHRLRVALVPTGRGWSDVAMAMVDLRHRDGPELYEETLPLAGLGDFVEWEAPARPDGPREIEWRYHVSFQDGRFEESDWQQAAGSVLPIPLAGLPGREVQLLPIAFDPARITRIEVRLTSGGQSETVLITDASPRSVILPPGPFHRSLTWWLKDGSKIEIGDEESDEEVLVLRLPS